MGHYIKYNKNYWDRKIFDENSKFDTEILKHQSVGINKSQNLFKKYVELVCLEMSYYCNRACSYCPVAIYERSDKNLEIDNELFLSIITLRLSSSNLGAAIADSQTEPSLHSPSPSTT